jgi:hypothetical protein
MAEFDKLMSNPFFNAGIGILQGQTPSRTRPNFAANAMGGLQNAMANRTSIQNQSALETERERQKIEYEQKQKQILAEQEFLASINAGIGQPTTTSPNRLPTQLSPSGIPNILPTGQPGGMPPIPGQGEIQQRTTTPTQQYVSKLNQSLVRINNALHSGKIPSISKYNELLVDKEKVEKEIYEATKLQDSPTSIQEYNLALEQGYKGTFQQWKAETKIPGVNIHMNDESDKWGKLPAEYAWKRNPQDGSIYIDPKTGLPEAYPIIGSPAALTRDEEEEENASREVAEMRRSIENAGTMLSAVDGIRYEYENSTMPITGTGSGLVGNLSMSAPGKVRSYVAALQSGVALRAMAQLKAASPSGATGFGAMNKQELNLLINEVGALDPDNTDPEIFMQTIDRIGARYNSVMKDIIASVSYERIQETGMQPLIDDYKARQPGQRRRFNPATGAFE